MDIKTKHAASPTSEEIKNLRKEAGLTRIQAAELVYSSSHVWTNWEGGRGYMHPSIWFHFQHLANNLIKVKADFEAYDHA